MPIIPRKVLTERLKELERDALINRVYYREIPPRVEYSLTDRGRSMTKVLDEMANWGLPNASFYHD